MSRIKINRIIIVAVLFLFIAETGMGRPLENSAIKKEIQSNLHIKTLKPDRVDVMFTTDDFGRVNLAIANAKDSHLKHSIEKSFMRLKFENLVPNNCYSVVLDIKVK